MDAKTAFFYLFAVVLLVAAFRVVTARNPVHAVLNLILAFSQAAAIWLLLKAEFLAIALILVYLGAVMVLFLFVVMMLDINIEKVRSGFTRHFWLGITVAIVLFLEVVGVVVARGLGSNVDMKSGKAPGDERGGPVAPGLKRRPHDAVAPGRRLAGHPGVRVDRIAVVTILARVGDAVAATRRRLTEDRERERIARCRRARDHAARCRRGPRGWAAGGRQSARARWGPGSGLPRGSRWPA